MTDNKVIGAFKRLLTMTLALVMVLGSAIPIFTQEGVMILISLPVIILAFMMI